MYILKVIYLIIKTFYLNLYENADPVVNNSEKCLKLLFHHYPLADFDA